MELNGALFCSERNRKEYSQYKKKKKTCHVMQKQILGASFVRLRTMHPSVHGIATPFPWTSL